MLCFLNKNTNNNIKWDCSSIIFHSCDKATPLSSSTSLFLHRAAYHSIICMGSENQHDSRQARKVLWAAHWTLLLGKFFFSPFLTLHPFQLVCEFFDPTGNNTTIRELKTAASKSAPALTATLFGDYLVLLQRVGAHPNTFVTAAFHLHFSWEFQHPSPFGMNLNTSLNLPEDEWDLRNMNCSHSGNTWHPLHGTRFQCSCATHSSCCRSTQGPQ